MNGCILHAPQWVFLLLIVSNVDKPTIGDYNKSIETHIFGVNEELYGREIKIEFLDYIDQRLNLKI